jgi:hypothetical protein
MKTGVIIGLSLIAVMSTITITVATTDGQQERGDNNRNNVPNVTRYDEEGRPYDNKNDITVIGVDGIFQNKTDVDDVHSIEGLSVETETLRPMCDNPNYEQQKEEINNIINDTIGREIKCFNYDENYVMYLEGTMYYLDFNDWLDMIDAGCKWDSDSKKMVCS